MNLGRADQVDVAGLRRLAASINKHFGDGEGLSDAAETGAVAGAGPLEVVDARTIGAIWLLDQLWRRLDVGAAVRTASNARRFTTNMGDWIGRRAVRVSVAEAGRLTGRVRSAVAVV
jgi:hypothetical protein